MSQLGQAQVGTLKSTPKVCTVKGDDNLKVIYKNMGNGHAVPMLWTDTITVASGSTTATVSSGIKMHGLALASYANVQVTAADANAGEYSYYITKDTGTNVISLVTSSAVNDNAVFDVKFMLGMSDPAFTTAFRDMDSPVNVNVPDGAA